MIDAIALMLAIIFTPYLMMLLARKVKALGTLGTVFLSYAAGLILSLAFKALGLNMSLAETLSSVLVLIAMPLILFSADLRSLRKLAKPMLASFAMDIAAVIAVAAIGFFIFGGLLSGREEAAKISGMLIGTYTGGTPNMLSIGKALQAGDSIMLTQTADMMAGGIYFFLLISVLPRALGKLLPRYKSTGAVPQDTTAVGGELGGKGRIADYLKLIGLSVLCVGVAMGAAILIPSRLGRTGFDKLGEHTAVIMLVVTTLGIALSFVRKVRTTPGSYHAGQYFILMFSVAMGLCFDLKALSGAMMIFAMLLFVQFCAVAVHIVLAKIFGIDRDTMMITSTAGVFGPAFIIPVANALKNDEIIVSGLICGILGYVIGNYLGIGLGEVLLSLC